MSVSLSALCVFSEDFYAVPNLSEASMLFAQGVAAGNLLSCAKVGVVVIRFVSVGFYVGFVYVYRSSSRVFVVRGSVGVLENGLLKASRESHIHAIGVSLLFAAIKMVLVLFELTIHVVVQLC